MREAKVRAVREAGGLGDVVTCLPVFKGYRRKFPQARRYFFSWSDYAAILDRAVDVDVWVNTQGKSARRRPRLSPLDPRKYPYLEAVPGPWVAEADLWCPAWPHEYADDNPSSPVTKSRIRLFAEAAGVWDYISEDPRARLTLTYQDDRAALDWFNGHGLDPRTAIIWQPYPTDSSRRWPLGRIGEVTEGLRKEGYQVVLPHCVKRAPDLEKLGGVTCLDEPLSTILGMIRRVPLVIGPDSAFMHLAGVDGVDTPMLSLHGKTGGAVAQGPYPLGNWIQGKGEACQSPCWHRQAWGHDRDKCRAMGCSAMLSIQADQVLQAALEILHGRGVFWALK